MTVTRLRPASASATSRSSASHSLRRPRSLGGGRGSRPVGDPLHRSATARSPGRLHRAGLELGAGIAAFDATDFDRLGRFFDALPTPIDHLLVTGPGPCYAPLAEFDLDAARRDVDAHLLLPLQVAKDAA